MVAPCGSGSGGSGSLGINRQPSFTSSSVGSGGQSSSLSSDQGSSPAAGSQSLSLHEMMQRLFAQGSGSSGSSSGGGLNVVG